MKSICVAILFSLCALSGYSLEVKGFPPDQTVVYKTIGDIALAVDIFNPPGLNPSDKRPAIVFFHGGAWAGGEKSQMHAHCAYLASRGMVAMSADYRCKNPHGTTPKECVKDGKSAVRWVRTHAGELGIDPNKVLAGGASAGGHVAAATGTVTAFDDEPGSPVSCIPNALVLFNPVFDNGPGDYGNTRVKDYWQKISPAHNINSNTPPTVVFFGTEDQHVPVATAQRYKQRMDELGLRCDLHLYPGEKHQFFNYRYTPMFIETSTEMDKFLTSLGYLQGAPTVQNMPAASDMKFVRREKTKPTSEE